MDYRSLICRIRQSISSQTDRERIRLYIRRDEAPSLLRSLETVHQAAQRGYRTPGQLYQDVQSLHEALAALNRENESLRAQLAEAKNQHALPLPTPACTPKPRPLAPALPHNRDALDPWQIRALEAADRRRAMGAWQAR
jgi:hypothetical protein